eukprot:COSAG01_NODE_3532_length_5963_cov_21.070771_4_plen_66_part_00
MIYPYDYGKLSGKVIAQRPRGGPVQLYRPLYPTWPRLKLVTRLPASGILNMANLSQQFYYFLLPD